MVSMAEPHFGVSRSRSKKRLAVTAGSDCQRLHDTHAADHGKPDHRTRRQQGDGGFPAAQQPRPAQRHRDKKQSGDQPSAHDQGQRPAAPRRAPRPVDRHAPVDQPGRNQVEQHDGNKPRRGWVVRAGVEHDQPENVLKVILCSELDSTHIVEGRLLSNLPQIIVVLHGKPAFWCTTQRNR